MVFSSHNKKDIRGSRLANHLMTGRDVEKRLHCQVSSTQRARILTYPGRWLVDIGG